jgi:hypothetical protein
VEDEAAETVLTTGGVTFATCNPSNGGIPVRSTFDTGVDPIGTKVNGVATAAATAATRACVLIGAELNANDDDPDDEESAPVTLAVPNENGFGCVHFLPVYPLPPLAGRESTPAVDDE